MKGTVLMTSCMVLTPIVAPISVNAQHVDYHLYQDRNAFEQNQTLLIDVARQHLTKQQVINLLMHVDPNKFPMVELHLTDDQGCSLQSNVLGNRASDTVFDQQALSQILQVAKQRGLTIIPDVDVPSHCTAIINQLKQINSPWLRKGIVMNDGCLDYTNPNTYEFVHKLYQPVIHVFKNQNIRLFNVGCDEVPGNVRCGDQLADFLNQIDHQLNHNGFAMIVWNDSLQTAYPTLSRNILIDHWNNTGASINALQRAGFDVKRVDPNANYLNLENVHNRQLVTHKLDNFNDQAQGGKLLALWGGNDDVTPHQLQLLVEHVQRKVN